LVVVRLFLTEPPGEYRLVDRQPSCRNLVFQCGRSCRAVLGMLLTMLRLIVDDRNILWLSTRNTESLRPVLEPVGVVLGRRPDRFLLLGGLRDRLGLRLGALRHG